MTSTTTAQLQDQRIDLLKNGIKKLETFFKIAVTKEETCFIEINPEQNNLKLNSIDPSHITNTITTINNDNGNDFETIGLDKILQFNITPRDVLKTITLNPDCDIKIIPVIDEQSNFDSVKIMLLENNIILKEIFLPIFETTNTDLYKGTVDLINNFLTQDETIIINIELQFLIDVLKESEIFNNERIRFNVSVKDNTIERLSIETFDNQTDKTRRIKTNLFQGLHFNTIKIINSSKKDLKFSIMVSFPDLKKILVTSNIYKQIKLILAEKTPVCLIYDIEETSIESQDVTKTLITLLAPIIQEDNQS